MKEGQPLDKRAEWARVWDLIAKHGGWDGQLEELGLKVKEFIEGEDGSETTSVGGKQ